MNTLIKYSITLLASSILSTPIFAESPSPSEAQKSPWAISTSLGMAQFESMEGRQGQTAMGRLGLNYALSKHLGLEAGIQNGNQMRFDLTKETKDSLGGMSVVGTTKPQLDVLFTAISPSLQFTLPTYGIVKAGVAYRQLQLDRDSINDLQELSPELQAGIGFHLSERLNLVVMYQHVFDKNPTLVTDALSETAHLTHIPSQSALMLGLNYCLE